MCFIAVLQLSVAGGAAGILFLYVERWLYEKIPSKYIIWLNIVALLMFVIPFFTMLMTKEDFIKTTTGKIKRHEELAKILK